MSGMKQTRRPGRLSLALLIVAVALSVPLVLGLFGAVHPAFDSFAHFRLHLAAATGLGALPLLATVLWREGLMAIAFAAAITATTFTNGGRADAAPATHETGLTFTLLQFNTRFDNADPKALVRLLAREQPDIVTLQEVSVGMRGWLERTRGTYAFQHYCDSHRVIGGAAILSRRPWTAGHSPSCAEDGYVAQATVDLAGTAVDVAAIHLPWPWPHGQADRIAQLEPVLAGLAANAVIAGDFNAAPWSAAMRSVAATSRATVLSPGATWLGFGLPLALRPLAGLPIDHVLVKGAAALEKPWRLGDAGSDHLPVMLRFAVPAPGDGATEDRATVMLNDGESAHRLYE